MSEEETTYTSEENISLETDEFKQEPDWQDNDNESRSYSTGSNYDDDDDDDDDDEYVDRDSQSREADDPRSFTSRGSQSYSSNGSRSYSSRGSQSQSSRSRSHSSRGSASNSRSYSSRGSASNSRSYSSRGSASRSRTTTSYESNIDRSNTMRSTESHRRSRDEESGPYSSQGSASFSRDSQSQSFSSFSKGSQSQMTDQSRSLKSGSTRSSRPFSARNVNSQVDTIPEDSASQSDSASRDESTYEEEELTQQDETPEYNDNGNDDEESTFYDETILNDTEEVQEENSLPAEDAIASESPTSLTNDKFPTDETADYNDEVSKKEAEDRFNQSFQSFNETTFARPNGEQGSPRQLDQKSSPAVQSNTDPFPEASPKSATQRSSGRSFKSPGTYPRSPRKASHRPNVPNTAATTFSNSNPPSGVKMQIEPVVKMQRCKSLAILGTMSDAGKSIMTAGLCRVLANHGMKVAPFKGQNMSNNASPALLPDAPRRRTLYKSFKKAVGGEFPETNGKKSTGYGEIGTAQSLQAEACRVVPRVEMNPVLLKSGGQNEKGEYMCSVFVLGQQVVRETYGDLGNRTTELRTMVLESHQALAEATGCDVILMEGAGSCSELNLMERDIVNLPLVRALQCPWLLVANIDCGGVFAQIVGTKMCVSKRDWSLCVGIIVNKLRGEAKYFEPGPKMIEDIVGKPVFVVPFLRDLNLPEEDGMGMERRLAWEASGHHHPESSNDEKKEKKPVVVVVAYPHTAISDDICPLEGDPRFIVQWRRRRIPKPYPHTEAVILPGSRLTQMDLKWLHDSGWSAFLRKHVALGGNVLGICGGYQMLGWSVDDPDGIEGTAGVKQGLGLLPIRTTIAPPEVKVVAPREGKLFHSNTKVRGFELHCGQSDIVTELGESLSHQIHPLLSFNDGRPEGMRSGRVKGTYMHGILWSPQARAELLVDTNRNFSIFEDLDVQDPLDRLADHLESCGLSFSTLQGFIGKSSTES